MDVLRPLALGLALALAAQSAAAHISVWPRQSAAGAREKYVIRTPNERRAATVRIEARFPAEVKVSAFEQKPGWTIEPRRNAQGQIVGAVWTGSLPPDQFAEFGVLAINPTSNQTLTWSFTQVYANGETVQWSGPPGSSTPAPTVDIRPTAQAAGEHRH